ncbi:hypothetical protein ACIHCV_45615 [Streptomyces sp. NPDC051956]|uniref:hypothetical protein n=1 Tax=Streptomyces sp. NPDC051956 TaxID=3365677 RepID=UPI0037D50E95
MVEDLAPDAADHPLAVGVHPRGPRRAHKDLHFLGFEDGVEGARSAARTTRSAGLNYTSDEPSWEYALAVGPLDEAYDENLEHHQPSPRLRRAVADTGLITVTGGVGYITPSHLPRAAGE